MMEWVRSGAWMQAASFVAAIVSVVLFALAWGSRDAAATAINTWRELAEGYEKTIKELEKEITELRGQVDDLRAEIAAQRKTTKDAIDELIAGFARAGEK